MNILKDYIIRGIPDVRSTVGIPKFAGRRSLLNANQNLPIVNYHSVKTLSYQVDKLPESSDTPCTTRTNSPDIDDDAENDVEYENYRKRLRDQIIHKYYKETSEGFVFTNGYLRWINGRPHYIVKLEGYKYYEYQINLYYELFGHFDARFGFYDDHNNFIEFDI
jgi:hypothetical protein